MSKVILEFNTPEENSELQDALHGIKYKYVLTDLDEELRKLYKYEDQKDISIEKVRQMIYELLNDRDLSLYD